MTNRPRPQRRYIHTTTNPGLPLYITSTPVPERPKSLTASEAIARLYRTTLITPADRRAIAFALMDDDELEAIAGSLSESFA